MPLTRDLMERLQPVKLLALDVDGVLTQSEVIYTDDGREIKIFNAKDGHGIALLVASGFHVALITGRRSEITARRARELGIQHVFQGVKQKVPVLTELMATLRLQPAEVAYMGDDTPDIPVLTAVGFSACPSDAVREVQRVCHYTAQLPGGKGAVREVADMLLRARLLQGLALSRDALTDASVT